VTWQLFAVPAKVPKRPPIRDSRLLPLAIPVLRRDQGSCRVGFGRVPWGDLCQCPADTGDTYTTGMHGTVGVYIHVNPPVPPDETLRLTPGCRKPGPRPHHTMGQMNAPLYGFITASVAPDNRESSDTETAFKICQPSKSGRNPSKDSAFSAGRPPRTARH